MLLICFLPACYAVYDRMVWWMSRLLNNWHNYCPRIKTLEVNFKTCLTQLFSNQSLKRTVFFALFTLSYLEKLCGDNHDEDEIRRLFHQVWFYIPWLWRRSCASVCFVCEPCRMHRWNPASCNEISSLIIQRRRTNMPITFCEWTRIWKKNSGSTKQSKGGGDSGSNGISWNRNASGKEKEEEYTWKGHHACGKDPVYM